MFLKKLIVALFAVMLLASGFTPAPVGASHYPPGLCQAFIDYNIASPAGECPNNPPITTSTSTTTTTLGCAAPTNFRITSMTSSTVAIAWNAVPNATSYDVYFAGAPNPPSVVYASGFSSSPATLYGIGSGSDFNLAVKAICGSSSSALSNVVNPTGGATTTTTIASTTTTTIGSANVCSINPGQGEVAITAAINSCPDGTVSNPRTIQFPANQSYSQAHKIEVKDRSNIIIDGNGSTFTTTANGATTKAIDGNWVLLRGQNITLKNMKSVGSFNIAGPRNLNSENVPEYTEAAMNYGIYGTNGAWLIDVKGFNPWGDGVTLGPDTYIDGSTADYATNVHIIRMEVRKTSRHCWSPTSGVGVWIEDSYCGDAWYAALDAETDSVDQPLQNHHYLRNTFDGFNLGGLLIPVPGTIGTVRDIEIRGNKFLTVPDVSCNQTIVVGAYPNIGPGYEIANVVVEDNEMITHGTAISFDHVNGGSIKNNIIDLEDNKGCNYPNPAQPISVVSSTNVTVGPNTIR